MAGLDPEKLLGGYATGTLTEAERKALFDAARHDRRLFDALAGEQALKEVLKDPVRRRRLVERLQQADRAEQKTEGWGALVPAWLHLPTAARAAARPGPDAPSPVSRSARPEEISREGWMLAGVLACVVLAIGALAYWIDEATQQAEPMMAADSRGLAASAPAPVTPGMPAAESRPPRLSARDLFYAAPGGGTLPQKPLGLRYSIVQRGTDGSEREASPAMVFGDQDAPRLSVEVNARGYLYVLKRIPPGLWSLLYPAPSARPDPGGREAYVEGGTRYDVPPAGALAEPGERGPAHLVIILARDPQPELADLLYTEGTRPRTGPSEAARINDLVKQIRRELAGGRLLVQPVDPSQPDIPDEQAVYVVDQRPAASRILAEVMVSHR